ncbi:MAG: CZB domain-containing protein, partial [Burkholderiales bacterium]|nr:CZB domain-containing protein [Burkholderiales bacterium]
LLQLGCEHAQGYGVARPMPADRLAAWAADWQPDVLWTQAHVVPQEVLPMLTACVEHRAWVNAMESYFTGERDTPPPLHPEHCNFGKWFQASAPQLRAAQPTLQTIDAIHRHLHDTATAMCASRSLHQPDATRANMLELQAHSAALVTLLKQLIGQSVRSA